MGAAGAFVEPFERWPYLILFLSVAMACFGSGYYHLMPDNDRLMWDRLPIAIGITALLAATLNERINPKLGSRLLPVLVAIGTGTVVHWHWSEQRGIGNLNFYVFVQFYSLLAVILLAIFSGRDIPAELIFTWRLRSMALPSLRNSRIRKFMISVM